MAGVLSFALGLETSAFSSALDRAGGRLFAFISAGKLLETVLDGVWSAIERGGALTDLSARTGEAVSDLYRLQEAFKVVGIEADSVPGMINRLNQSLSGVGEMGQRTDSAFAALGLSMNDLKRLDAPQQFNAIIASLAKVDNASGIGLASQIFGREGAGNIMQLTRDAQSFRATLADSAAEAQVFARNAATFDEIGDSLTRIKGKVGGLFAGLAASIAPEIQKVENYLKTIDFVGIGQQLGTVISGAFEAFREGKLSLLIAETIQFGFEAGFASIGPVLQKFGVTLLKLIETPLTYLQAGFQFMEEKMMEWVSKLADKLNIPNAISGFKASSFGDILDQTKRDGVSFFTQGNTLDSLNQSANDALKDALSKVGADWKELFGTFADFAARAKQGSIIQSPEKATPAVAPLFQKLDVSNIERMGFVFNGRGIAQDYNKDTAQHTKDAVSELRRANVKLTKIIEKNQPLTNI